jgi:hypothetical protein
MTTRDPTFDIGDLVEVVVKFVDVDGQPADPTSITFKQRSPDGTIVPLSETDASNPGVGEWRWLMPGPFDAAGTWHFRAEATNGLITAVEQSVRVRKSAF